MNQQLTQMRTVAGREISMLLNPRPLALITTTYEGQDYIATCAWTTPVSHEPPMLAFALRPGGMTAKAIELSGTFIVHLVDQSLAHAVRQCGTPSKEDRFALIDAEKTEGKAVSCKGIDGALARLECTLEQVIPCGDHALFVGLVELAEQREQAIAPYSTSLLCLKRDKYTALARKPYIIREMAPMDTEFVSHLFAGEDMGEPAETDEIYVAMDLSGDSLGAIRLEKVEDKMFVRPVVVREDLRGAGIGSALIRFVLELYPCLYLVARGTATIFYLGLGFEKIDWDEMPEDISQECLNCEGFDLCQPTPMKS